MIVSVDTRNEPAWLALCLALWPDHTLEEMRSFKSQGRFANEFLYMDGTNAAAFISLSLRHDYVEGTESTPVGYIEGLYVAPEYRRQGIAGKLVDFAKQWTIKQGCRELASDVEYGNEPSRAFHKHSGFTEANIVVCFAMKLNTGK